MKERAYPVYTVNKHADGQNFGWTHWLYFKDIRQSP